MQCKAMDKRQILLSLTLLFLSLLLFSSVACVYAQDNDNGDGESDPLKDFVNWLNGLWGGFVGSVEDLINWLWEQFYNMFIAPVVEGFKATVSGAASAIREPIDWMVYELTVQIPYWFVSVFGPAAPIAAAAFLGVFTAGMYLAVKLVITLL